jgi:hypothetical protein
MPAPRRFDIDELLLRPGTYFNPETEILLVVDDSAVIEADILEEGEGGDWLLVSDDHPLDEPQRDALLEAFQARHGGEATGPGEADDDLVEDEEELEPDPDPDDDRY